MNRHILIPVALDHEAVVPRKIDVARRLLAEDGRITLLTVLEDVPGFVTEFAGLKSENHLTRRIKDHLDQMAKAAPDITTVVVTGRSGVKIASFAAENDVDLIIVGSHQPGAKDYFLGSTASRVARRAHCSVYIVR